MSDKDRQFDDLTDAEWHQLAVKAREVEIEDRKSNFDRSRPPLLVAVDQRILRWAHRRLDDLEQAVRALAALVTHQKNEKPAAGADRHQIQKKPE